MMKHTTSCQDEVKLIYKKYQKMTVLTRSVSVTLAKAVNITTVQWSSVHTFETEVIFKGFRKQRRMRFMD